MKIAMILISFSILMAQAEAKVQLKIGPELFASLAAATSVSIDAELRDLFKLNVNRLPKAGSTEEMSNGVVLATTELGGAFCKRALDRDRILSAGRRLMPAFALVNFKRGPSQFGDYLKGAFFDELAVSFWQRNVTEAEKTKLSAVLADTVKDSNDTAEETVALMHVMCTTYATSLAFLVK